MDFSQVQAANMVRLNNKVRTLAGSEHRVLLRKFVKPVLDDDFKEAVRLQQEPLKEFIILAKVRALSENEMIATEVGVIKKGDIFVMVDPDIIVTNLDELRFLADTQLEDLTISHTWDYTIFDIKRIDFNDIAIGRSFVARRKMEQTPGGDQP